MHKTKLALEEGPSPPVPENPPQYLVQCVRAAKLGDGILVTLYRAGLNTVDAIQAASDKEVLEVNGIGPTRLTKIREIIG